MIIDGRFVITIEVNKPDIAMISFGISLVLVVAYIYVERFWEPEGV